MNHAWAVTLGNAEATKELFAAEDLKVKDRPYILIDSDNQGLHIKILWLLYGLTDEEKMMGEADSDEAARGSDSHVTTTTTKLDPRRLDSPNVVSKENNKNL
ncbi:hypothetical protein HPB50_017944 [Hyalomma asiaticum]|uniref:Uncharacterized protein n=1 Tax=Hyalomma asiaticum TaxID=266040 RepID=A0ACB7RQC4_HYAAI|nr:hypothetical protein HPB50_028055 [Hyalomma asiaticum]KAH6922689.1 hypothetical protein HPB50_017944 [Hyalomma asiaticum]